MGNYTPGPWEVRLDKKDIVMEMSLGETVATVGMNVNGSFKANARLIAAAPDMFEMLQRIEEYGVLHGIMESDLKAIIAKAKGE